MISAAKLQMLVPIISWVKNKQVFEVATSWYKSE